MAYLDQSTMHPVSPKARRASRHFLPSGIAVVFAALGLLSSHARAEPAVLYSEPAHESPVRGEPNDLLLLPGYGLTRKDVVVYAAVEDTTASLTAPRDVPQDSSADRGVAPVVSAQNTPYSLTVRLPRELEANRSYALWVRNERGEWSNGVKINDARPLWVTPPYVRSTVRVAAMPRRLKVVGRNLQPAPGATTVVRLEGPDKLELVAADDKDPATAIEHYAAIVDLPPRLSVGSYRVSVSRDRRSWVPLNGQALEVAPDDAGRREFPVGAGDRCRADDADDDSSCIVAAISAARAAGGGIVTLGPGVWRLDDPRQSDVPPVGIIVPEGVEIAGAGAAKTTIARGTAWAQPAFALAGMNAVRGLRFTDARIYGRGTDGAPMLRLGAGSRADDRLVDNVVITQNVFDKPYVAIADSGVPIRRLFVTYNEFGAYYTALNPGGNRYNVGRPFRIDDTVIVGNRFEPGSYIDTSIAQGAIASQIGAAYRLDFSDNVADGASTRYLGSAKDPPGWRAAFFWHMNGNDEMMLVSRNTASCTGDKAGDGEAIAYDNNANTFALPSAQRVLNASRDTVTVSGPLLEHQNDRPVDVAKYYVEHWLQISAGKGLGQTRRIESYSIAADGSRVTFKVAPDWDVVPDDGQSRATVGRQFWQVYTVDNHIDHRRPPCLKSNRTKPKGGLITQWAQTADSTIEGNVQYDTDGISIQQNYSAIDKDCPSCTSGTFYQYFLEIRGNTIDGEYDWKSDCSQSGILLSHSAAPTPASPPPVLGYGVSIARNIIRHADALRGGAISVALTWHQGPPPHDWDTIESLLIHNNTIEAIDGRPPERQCDVEQKTRLGINLHQAQMVHGTVLYGNSCSSVAEGINDSARDTIRVCPRGARSCECP
jgi:hypothetical protein